MNWSEHNPPHFHARYQDDEATVNIHSGEVTGNISKRVRELIEEWRKSHIDSLIEDWVLAANHKQLNYISPLE